FELYKNHQEAQLVDSYGTQQDTISYTISKKNNEVTISICNYALENSEDLSFSFEDLPKFKEANYIVGDVMDAHNDFDQEEQVSLKAFTNYEVKDNQLLVSVPAMSVTTLTVEV